MSVRLRPHHLFCILTYVGRGYSPAFVENMNRIVRAIAHGETAEIVSGPDDICAPLLGGPSPHCRNDSVPLRDACAGGLATACIGLPVQAGAKFALTPAALTALRAAMAAGKCKAVCDGCPWQDLCREIAGEKFRGTHLCLLGL